MHFKGGIVEIKCWEKYKWKNENYIGKNFSSTNLKKLIKGTWERKIGSEEL